MGSNLSVTGISQDEFDVEELIEDDRVLFVPFSKRNEKDLKKSKNQINHSSYNF